MRKTYVNLAGNLKEKYALQELSVNRKKMLKKQKQTEGMNCTERAQKRVGRRSFMNTVVYCHVYGCDYRRILD